MRRRCDGDEVFDDLPRELEHLAHVILGRVIGDPHALLLVGGVEEALGALHGLHVQVRDVLAVGERDAHLVLGREHHVVLGQAARAVKDGHDALLHGHLALIEAPRGRVVPAVLAALGLDGHGDTSARVRHAPRLLYAVGRVALSRPGGGLAALEVLLIVILAHLLVVLLVRQAGGLSSEGKGVLLQGLVNFAVVLDLGQPPCVDSLCGVLLLNNAEHTVVQVLVEVLGVGEGDGTSRTLASGIGCVSRGFAALVATSRLLAAVWRGLLDTVHSRQMPLEDIGAVERLLSRGTGSRTETAHHCSLVVGQGVSVLVVLAREALDVVIARLNWALFGAFRLVRQHVRLQVLEGLTTVGVWASLLLLGLIAAIRVLLGGLEGSHAGPSVVLRRNSVRAVLEAGNVGRSAAISNTGNR
jgi:hypothetical protein